MSLPWQIPDAEKERQLAYLPPSLQSLPAATEALDVRVGDLEAADIALEGRLTAVEGTLADATALATPSTLVLRDAGAETALAALQLDTLATPTGAPGKLLWNDTDGTLEFQLKGGAVTLQIGQEQVLRVRNAEATPLTDGTVVYVSGSNGVHNLASRANASTEAASARTIGVVTEPIAVGADGFVTVFGMVRGLDTNHLVEGGLVYLSTVSGETTATPVTPPNHSVLVGYCIKRAGGNGAIFVHVQNGYELHELHDVLIGTQADGDMLAWDAAAQVWRNRTAGTAPWVLKAGDTMLGALVLAASVAGAAGTAALKIPSGPLLLTPEAGAVERLVDKLYLTISGGTRKPIVLADASLTSGRIPFTTTDGRLADWAGLLLNILTGDITHTAGISTNKLGVGTTLPTLGNTKLVVGTSLGGFSGSYAVAHFVDNSLNATVNYQNTNVAGFTAFDLFNSAGVKTATFAWSNASAGLFPSTLWFMSRIAADMVLGTNGTEVMRLRNSTKDVEIATGNLVLPKTQGVGVKVDPAAPTFGWRDLTCAIDPKATGGGSPSRLVYRGTIYAYAFAVGDLADFDGFHIPHDYVPGSNIYVHVHWSHNGTAISGTAAFEVTMSYAKGHNQANFPAEVTQTITVATPDIATVPQYRHRVDEVQASTPGGSATLHNTTDLEVDGLMIGYIKLVTLPTITGGNLFIHTVDIHYQSTNMATKQKSPGFYT